MKYREKQFIEELTAYVSSTYGLHYSSGDDSIQTLDLIEACGDAEHFHTKTAAAHSAADWAAQDY